MPKANTIAKLWRDELVMLRVLLFWPKVVCAW
jgi:hypothetical protein